MRGAACDCDGVCRCRVVWQEDGRSDIALHFMTLHYIVHYIALYLHCITLHYMTLYYITSHYITLHCIALHCIALHCTALHHITLHYITLHYITRDGRPDARATVAGAARAHDVQGVATCDRRSAGRHDMAHGTAHCVALRDAARDVA